MARLKIHDQLARGLTRLGFIEEKRTTRYRIFRDPRAYDDGRTRFVYLGKVDAVRRGWNVETSIPVYGLKSRAMTAGLSEKWEDAYPVFTHRS